jgi:hypothetical protein
MHAATTPARFAHLLSIAALVLALFCATRLPGQTDDKDAIKALQATQRAPALTLEAVADRRAALEGLRGLSSEDVAKALVIAYEQSEREHDQLRARSLEIDSEVAKLIAGQEDAKQITLPQAQLDRYNAIRQEQTELGKVVEAHVLLQGFLRELIGEQSTPDAREYLVETVLPSAKLPLPIRIAAAESLAGADDQDLVKELVKRLGRAKRGPDLVVLCGAVAAVGEPASAAAADLLDLLENDEAIVRDRAARALASLRVVEAIEPLIDLLEASESDARHAAEIAGSLQALTGEKHGVIASIWRSWWRDNKDRILAGDAPLGGGMFELPEVKTGGYYFDIPQDGKSIFYVIDASGSMEAEVDASLAKKVGGKEAEKLNRLEACKLELISAIRRLDKDQQFNIIWYSSEVHEWQDRMKDATPSNVRDAVAWIEKLNPAGSTNIYGAMQKAFENVGQGARDKYYGVAFDTMFLLTDGTPTQPSGEVDSTDKILVAVDGWNALKRVHIHCIGIGQGVNRPFLEKLAKDNGGQYRSY